MYFAFRFYLVLTSLNLNNRARNNKSVKTIKHNMNEFNVTSRTHERFVKGINTSSRTSEITSPISQSVLSMSPKCPKCHQNAHFDKTLAENSDPLMESESHRELEMVGMNGL